MILAGIDIGTNTLRLLVAETNRNTFQELFSARTITRLGQNLDRSGKLSPDAMERSCAALQDFSHAIKNHSALYTAVVGTSALRNASNSTEFIEKVKRSTDLSIRTIPGDEEARLTLLGVTQVLRQGAQVNDNPLQTALIIDIGGGSTECILTQPGRAPMIESLPLGAVYLTERFIKHDPPLPQEIESLRCAVNDIFDKQLVGMQPERTLLFVGTAGTITTLAAIDQRLREYEPDRINGHTMSRTSIDAIVEKLMSTSLQERRAIPGLENGREDIILAGSVITQELMKRFGFISMIVSDWGLREGIVLDLYEKVTTGFPNSG
jgi:exopolyphosphatase/guanosine-5'-triphosphate,3'-diphosphate pyrophosphatase